jgi:hypothetical protein
MSGAIHPLPQYAFMAWCLVKHRDNFTLHIETIAIKAPRILISIYLVL